MKYDIIFAGVGGQGIVSAAAMLVAEASKLGLHCKQNEVHGMAQRGGSVVCHVRISDKEIFSDLIPKGAADIICSAEPMEALRYIEYLSANGKSITSTRPVKNIEYPEVPKILEALSKRCQLIAIDGDAIVNELKNERVINIAAIGALSKVLAIPHLREGILKDIEKRFGKKGPTVVEANKKAFEAGFSSASRALS